MQKSSDQMVMALEEKRMKMEERQMELMSRCAVKRQFQLQMMQMLMQQNIIHSMLPPTHYPMHSTFNFRSTSLPSNEFDPDETQDRL